METAHAPHDPIQKLKDIRNDLKGSHDRYHCQVLTVYNQALQIAENPFYLKRFREEDFWSGIAFPNCILRAAMRFVWNASEINTGDYKAAVFAASALQFYFNDAVTVEEVYDLIKNAGGIEPLHREQPPHSKAPQPQTTSWPNGIKIAGQRSLEAGHTDRAYRLTAQPKRSVRGPATQSAKSERQRRNGPKQFSRRWCEARLCLEIGSADLTRVLNSSKGSVTYVADGPDETGFLVFRVVGVN